jgi:PPM family protein phosphatase
MRLDDALQFALRTDPGLVRSHNEDAVFANPHAGQAILADGMGGYNAGEVASGMAVALLGEQLPQLGEQIRRSGGHIDIDSALQDLIGHTNDAIFRAAASQPQYAGMGTTLVLACFHDNKVTVAHIGDSRLYRLRDGQLVALTRDHSLLQEQIDSGMLSVEEARFSQNKNLVTRALGVDVLVEAEIHHHEAVVGDIYLLCSDGLNDMLSDEEIGQAMHTLGDNLTLVAEQLVEMAKDNGGRDNVSVILVKVRGDFSRRRSGLQKLLDWLR